MENLLHSIKDSTIGWWCLFVCLFCLGFVFVFVFPKQELGKEKHTETSGGCVASVEAGRKMGSCTLWARDHLYPKLPKTRPEQVNLLHIVF